KSKSFDQSRDEVFEKLHKLNVTDWMALNTLGAPSIKDVTVEQLLTLKTMIEEINRSDKTIEELFGSQYDKEIDALFEQLKKNETQRRLLRESYQGRAEELVKYLREQVGPGQSGTAIEAPKGSTRKKADKEQPKAEPQPEQKAEPDQP